MLNHKFCISLSRTTIGALVLSGHGHFSDGKTVAVFGNPVIG